MIPYGGVKGKAAVIICWTIHYILVLFRIKPAYLYKKYLSIATRYNNADKSAYVTSFEYAGGLKDRVKKEDLFTIKKSTF